MEALIILIAIVTIGDPHWLGRHLARAKVWYDFYLKEEKDKLRRSVARARLKRMKATRNERFKKRL